MAADPGRSPAHILTLFLVPADSAPSNPGLNNHDQPPQAPQPPEAPQEEPEEAPQEGREEAPEEGPQEGPQEAQGEPEKAPQEEPEEALQEEPEEALEERPHEAPQEAPQEALQEPFKEPPQEPFQEITQETYQELFQEQFQDQFHEQFQEKFQESSQEPFQEPFQEPSQGAPEEEPQAAPQAVSQAASQTPPATVADHTPRASQRRLIQKYYLDPGGFRPRFPRAGHNERCRKRIRGWHDDVKLFDTMHARYVFENDYFPLLYIRYEDFFKPCENLKRIEEEKEDVSKEPIIKFMTVHGLAVDVESNWWLRVDGEVTARVHYILSGLLKGFLRIPFKAIDTWKEEEDQIIGYPRDPYKRVDVHPCWRTIEFNIDEVVFKSNQAVVVFQPGFPARFYFASDIFKLKPKLPGKKVPMIRIKKTLNSKTIICPYKGEGQYYNLDIDGKVYEKIMWSYNRPNPEVALIKDRFCFSGQHPKITPFRIEGAIQEQPAGPADHGMTDEERELFSNDS
ncbi:hypothetical protein TWF696_004283 [Orbilia brochopaga]|uniref:DUF427 domain-containing protein n=1 Tax=Orbilia brochopaga TaxID=3140254 RepID=A0AAV9V7D9_9PEZI